MRTPPTPASWPCSKRSGGRFPSGPDCLPSPLLETPSLQQRIISLLSFSGTTQTLLRYVSAHSNPPYACHFNVLFLILQLAVVMLVCLVLLPDASAALCCHSAGICVKSANSWPTILRVHHEQQLFELNDSQMATLAGHVTVQSSLVKAGFTELYESSLWVAKALSKCCSPDSILQSICPAQAESALSSLRPVRHCSSSSCLYPTNS